MAKFLKSLFVPGEKKRTSRDGGLEGEERSDFAPPLDGRRKLSISRSGRMKQNKKRLSLAQDLFGEELHAPEKPSSKEYHVHGKTFSASQSATTEPPVAKQSVSRAREKALQLDVGRQTGPGSAVITPEEEIDNAFKVIDSTT